MKEQDLFERPSIIEEDNDVISQLLKTVAENGDEKEEADAVDVVDNSLSEAIEETEE